MSVPSWSATVAGNNLPNIQSVSLTQGQGKITDPFRSGSVTLQGRSPSSLPTITIGDTLSVVLSFNSLTRTFWFRVADYAVNYGVVSAMDEWTVTGEDAFAVLGRAEIDASWSSGSLAETNAKNVVESLGLTFTKATSLSSTATCNAQTIVNGNALDVLNTLAVTEGARLSASTNNVQWLPRNWQSVVPTVHASDDGTGTLPIKYDALQFTSIADNYADLVSVTVRGGNTSTVGTGVFSIGLNSYSVSDAEATNVAGFTKASLDVERPVPNRISQTLNAQTNNGWIEWDTYKKAAIKFRGTTFNAFVIGVNYSADPNVTRVTWNLASSEFYRFLTLDDATLGKLDENKLGW